MINQLEGEIRVPDNLDFECSDRSLLMDQLKVLQMVLRKQKNSNGGGMLTASKESSSKAFQSGNSTLNQSLKDKVGRHKQAVSERRESKLKEMDDTAEALYRSSTSNGRGDLDSSKIHTVRKELNDLKIAIEKTMEDSSSQGQKRSSNIADGNENEKKKSRTNHNRNERIQEHTQSTNTSSESSQSSSSSKKKSIFEAYQSCTSAKTREELREKAIKMMEHQGLQVSVVEPGQFALKYALSAPYHLFLSRIQKSKETYDQQFSITFPEILDRSLGEIVSSLQINFMVDVGWLCLQYLLAGQSTDNMLILYGERVDEEKVERITMLPVQMPTRFGCHHTKVMILKYKDDGIRVIVSTANLYSDDWETRTQGCVKEF